MPKKEEKLAYLMLIGSMVMFGTIGIFVRNIPLPSAVIAFVRGSVGGGFLLAVCLAKKIPLLPANAKAKLPALLVSGAMIGFNWILLFEAYRYTTVAIATLCYYFAPIFILIASPLLGEKLTGKKLVCVGCAVLGMVFVSGILRGQASGETGGQGVTGILLGLGAAALYAAVILMNKRLAGVESFSRTLWQLLSAAAIMVPYLLMTEKSFAYELSGRGLALLLIISVAHTGICYVGYFAALRAVPVQSAALLSYIDPVVAVLLSAWLLREKPDVWVILGAVLILGASVLSEISPRAGKKQS